MATRKRRDVTRLELARKAKGLTQVQFAGAVGVDPSTVSRWERREVEPSDGHLATVAEFVGCSPVELVGTVPRRHRAA